MVNEIVDIPLEMGNTPLDTVIKSLEYAPVKDILVKPLDPIKVTKEIVEQVPTGERDEDGFEKYEVSNLGKVRNIKRRLKLRKLFLILGKVSY